jgi:hypothetical protein
MGLSDDLTLSLVELYPIDEKFQPSFTFGRKILNVFTFGFHKKRYIPKKTRSLLPQRGCRKKQTIRLH